MNGEKFDQRFKEIEQSIRRDQTKVNAERWQELGLMTLRLLSPREKGVLSARFGLQTGLTMTYEEVGAEFGVTRERIRQIETKALIKLDMYWKKLGAEGQFMS